MTVSSQKPLVGRSAKASRTYELVVRGPDGHPRIERFETAGSYLARLLTLQQSPAASVSIEELAGLIDI
jgi:hypothetical protein